MKKVVVLFRDQERGALTLEGVEGIGFNQFGMIVVVDHREKPMGVFPADVVAGIYDPEEPSRVEGVSGRIIS